MDQIALDLALIHEYMMGSWFHRPSDDAYFFVFKAEVPTIREHSADYIYEVEWHEVPREILQRIRSKVVCMNGASNAK
jgi:hypothetical protein